MTATSHLDWRTGVPGSPFSFLHSRPPSGDTTHPAFLPLLSLAFSRPRGHFRRAFGRIHMAFPLRMPAATAALFPNLVCFCSPACSLAQSPTHILFYISSTSARPEPRACISTVRDVARHGEARAVGLCEGVCQPAEVDADMLFSQITRQFITSLQPRHICHCDISFLSSPQVFRPCGRHDVTPHTAPSCPTWPVSLFFSALVFLGIPRGPGTWQG